jgi:hypothetical protein
MLEAVSIVGDVTETRPTGRPRFLAPISFSHPKSDRPYSLYGVLGRHFAKRPQLCNGRSVTRDYYRFARFHAIDHFGEPSLRFCDTDSLVHMT